jgi:modulator of FtsH protease HflK
VLDWLNDIVRGLLAFVPRPILVRKTHGAVIFTRAKASCVGPGLYWYWPIWSEVERTSVQRKTVNLPYQALTTLDGEQVVVAVTVVYKITNVEAALLETDDFQDTIQDISHRAVKRVVGACSSSALMAGRTDTGKSVDSLLRRRLNTDLSPYGVTVLQGFIGEIAKPYILRVMGDVLAT